MTPATPMDAPATPPAQPYGSYHPTPADTEIAELVSRWDAGVFAFNDAGRPIVSILPRTMKRVH